LVVIIPPSPVAICFTGWNEKIAKSANFPLPQFCSISEESLKNPPGAWQESSIIHNPCSSASFLNSSKFTGLPAKSTGIIPLYVPLGDFSSNSLTLLMSSKYVSESISENITSPPQYQTEFADAANVIGVVITLSAFFTPKAMLHR